MSPSSGAVLVASLLLCLLHGGAAAEAASASSPVVLASNAVPAPRGPQDRQIIAMVLGLVVTAIVLFNWRSLRALPGANWWLAALVVRLFAWSVGMAQGFFQPANLHLLEHVALMLSTGLVTVAIWHAYQFRETSVPSRT